MAKGAKKSKKQTAKTMGLAELMARYASEEDALRYLESLRWASAVACVKCEGCGRITEQEKTGDYWCGDCRSYFSSRTGTPLERSKVELRKWILAGYLILTSRKGISSLQLSKELSVTQKTAWFMLHRLRAACAQAGDMPLRGEVEIDETYLGGKERNKHECKRLRAGRGAAGKTPVPGMRERKTGRTVAMPIPDTTGATLQGEIRKAVAKGSVLYIDEHRGYEGVEERGYERKAVCHSAKQFVDGMASTNTIESVWAGVKRGFYSIYHQWSKKHCRAYVNEFSFRFNEGNCERDTADCMDSLLSAMLRKAPLSCKELTADD